jgi:hypothetical protein
MLRLLSIAALLLAAGCSSRVAQSGNDKMPYTYYSLGGHITAYEFRLKDGTRCVGVGGNTGRGITCEWKAQP